jgi:hypothetical protein
MKIDPYSNLYKVIKTATTNIEHLTIAKKIAGPDAISAAEAINYLLTSAYVLNLRPDSYTANVLQILISLGNYNLNEEEIALLTKATGITIRPPNYYIASLWGG